MSQGWKNPDNDVRAAGEKEYVNDKNDSMLFAGKRWKMDEKEQKWNKENDKTQGEEEANNGMYIPTDQNAPEAAKKYVLCLQI